MTSLLRKYIRQIVLTEAARGKKLRVFDFDDTLVKTGSLIHVTSGTGERFDLTPGEFAVYVPDPGDDFDFSDFSRLVDPQAIKWTNQILRNILSGGGEVVILTARTSEAPVHQFLEEAGLPPLEVIALANADPAKKAEYIASRIESDGFDVVEFFDDSYKNVEAVRALSGRYPGVKIIARHVVHKTEIS
jgi:sulfur carrier protein ThiS